MVKIEGADVFAAVFMIVMVVVCVVVLTGAANYATTPHSWQSAEVISVQTLHYNNQPTFVYYVTAVPAVITGVGITGFSPIHSSTGLLTYYYFLAYGCNIVNGSIVQIGHSWGGWTIKGCTIVS